MPTSAAVFCPRTPRHADQRNRTSNLPITRCWLYPWATSTLPLPLFPSFLTRTYFPIPPHRSLSLLLASSSLCFILHLVLPFLLLLFSFPHLTVFPSFLASSHHSRSHIISFPFLPLLLPSFTHQSLSNSYHNFFYLCFSLFLLYLPPSLRPTFLFLSASLLPYFLCILTSSPPPLPVSSLLLLSLFLTSSSHLSLPNSSLLPSFYQFFPDFFLFLPSSLGAILSFPCLLTFNPLTSHLLPFLCSIPSLAPSFNSP